MSQPASGPDPIVNSDRVTGTTSPERGKDGNNVVGRPITEDTQAAFHEPADTAQAKTKPLNEQAALEEGGSFDGVAPLQDVDAE